MSQRTRKFVGTASVACLGLAAAMAGCLGDDSAQLSDAGRGGSAGAGGHVDASVPDTSTSDVSADNAARGGGSSEGSVPDVAQPDGAAGDGSTVDAVADTGARDTAIDSPRDTAVIDARDGSTVDAPVDAGVAEADAASDRGADVVTELTPDATPDAVASGPLQSCPTLDQAWGISTDAGGCATQTNGNCGDRAGTWAGDFTLAFVSGPMTTDCRISGFFDTVDGGAYFNQLLAFSVEFFGCPDPTSVEPGPLKFNDLIPPEQANHPFTTADIELISSYFTQALVDGRTNFSWSGVQPAPASFTTMELDQINAQLARLAAARIGTLPVNIYSFNSCQPDAGGGG